MGNRVFLMNNNMSCMLCRLVALSVRLLRPTTHTLRAPHQLILLVNLMYKCQWMERDGLLV